MSSARFHERMMQGGMPTGFRNGVMTYSQPVSRNEPQCPWHGPGCGVWAQLQESA